MANHKNQSDADAMSSSIQDPGAFLLIFDRHFDRIASYIARRTPASAVEELVSEVFLRALAGRRRFDRNQSDVLPWLYGIATNVLRESLRGERQELELVAKLEAASWAEQGADISNGVGPLEPLFANALLSLSPEEREPLLLYALADLDYGQIAEALGVPLGTVKSRISRTRNRLRRKMGKAGAVPPRLVTEDVQNG